MRSFLWIAAVALALTGCEKTKKEPAKQPPAATVAAEGPRSIPILVEDDAYPPDKIKAKAGEKLKLVFTRHSKAECGSQVKIADGTPVDLPVDQAVEIAVTAPASGKLSF